MAEHPTPEGILQLGLGFWGSKTLLSAVELGVFAELGKGPVDTDDLVQRIGLHRRSARDFLDSLVALGMLRREGDLYSNTAETELFLDPSKPTYVGGILEMANARLYGFWGSLTEGLRSGLPQNEVKSGGNFFDALYSNPAALRSFLAAMTSLSMGANMAIARKFPWSKYRIFVDVGAAQGGLPVQIALAHEHLSGGGFDLPTTASDFEEYVNSFDLAQRLRFYPGDFLTDRLPDSDVLIMGHVLHDWNIDEKRALVGKAYEALPDGGALIVYGSVIDDERRHNTFGLLMSLNMLIETPGGFDYTGADCQSWLSDAGFRDTYVEHLVGPDSMVVGFK